MPLEATVDRFPQLDYQCLLAAAEKVRRQRELVSQLAAALGIQRNATAGGSGG